MGVDAEAKRIVYRSGAFGAALVIAVVLGVEFAAPDFPSTSTASMVFFAALVVAAVINLAVGVARVLMKVPARITVNRWTGTLVISRISFAWAMFVLVAVTIVASIIDHQLARPLLHTVIVEVLLGAFWLLATSTVVTVAAMWSRIP